MKKRPPSNYDPPIDVLIEAELFTKVRRIKMDVPPDPQAMVRMLDYLIPEARLVNPSATLMLTIARKELAAFIQCNTGNVTSFPKS